MMPLDHGDLLTEEGDPEYDGAVPFEDVPHGDYHGQIVWFDRDEADELYDQLFPHGIPRVDDRTTGCGLAVVGLHSAFESYADAVGALNDGNRRQSLPQKIESHFRKRGVAYEAWLAATLVDCDATRHIIVHNRGVVDERFANRVRDNELVPGERRPLDFPIVTKFARALWRIAVRLREASSGVS